MVVGLVWFLAPRPFDVPVVSNNVQVRVKGKDGVIRVKRAFFDGESYVYTNWDGFLPYESLQASWCELMRWDMKLSEFDSSC